MRRRGAIRRAADYDQRGSQDASMEIKANLQWTSTERSLLGENPLWDGESATLYWIDVVGPAVYRLAGCTVTRFGMPKPVAALFLGTQGTLVSAGAKAAPDGYTITTGHVDGLAINPSIFEKLPYDIARNFVPITQMYKSPLLMLVAEGSPYKTLADVIAAAKANPGTITYSSGGNGNGAHLSGESLSALAGVSMKHIPYKTVSDALVGVAGGDITFSFGNLALGMPLVKGKKLRAIAFSGDTRVAEYPEIPVVGETVKGFEFNDWSGMRAPSGTPPAIVAKLQRDISAVLAQPEVIKTMRAQGLIPVQGTSEEFGKFIDSETKKWGQLSKSINLKLN